MFIFVLIEKLNDRAVNMMWLDNNSMQLYKMSSIKYTYNTVFRQKFYIKRPSERLFRVTLWI